MKILKIAVILSLSLIVLCSIFFFIRFILQGESYNLIVIKKNEKYNTILAKEVNGSGEYSIGIDKNISLVNKNNKKISLDSIKVSSKIKVYHNGVILESYPAKFQKVYKIVLMD